jgi:hypothetical protein
MEEAEASYAHCLAKEMRVMRRNHMKNAFVQIFLIVTAFLIYVVLVQTTN